MSAPVVPQKKEFTTSQAGVGGIIRNVETRTKDTDKALQAAFSDISALMEKAKEMVCEIKGAPVHLKRRWGSSTSHVSLAL